MALAALIKAAQELEATRGRIQSLKDEKQRLQDRIAAINAELASARADSDASIGKIKAEAPNAVSD